MKINLGIRITCPTPLGVRLTYHGAAGDPASHQFTSVASSRHNGEEVQVQRANGNS